MVIRNVEQYDLLKIKRMQLNNHSDYDPYDLVKTRLSDMEGDVQEKTITVFESGSCHWLVLPLLLSF